MITKIAFLGPKGSNSEHGVRNYIRLANIENVQEFPKPSIEDAIIALENQEVDLAIVPIENSVEGSINITLDRLARSSNLSIQAEFMLPIQYALFTKKNNRKKNACKILSHPQAIAQCREYIRKNYNNTEIVYTNSTSEAARMVLESEENWLAISSRKAIEFFDLEIVDDQIQDFQNNATRFVVLGQKEMDHSMGLNHKLSIVFSSQNKPGKLYEVLEVFKNLRVNLTKIESRPSKRLMGEYIFFADMELDHRENLLLEIQESLKTKTSFLKILGVYPFYPEEI